MATQKSYLFLVLKEKREKKPKFFIIQFRGRKRKYKILKICEEKRKNKNCELKHKNDN
jgi:hypothetical protein